MSSTDERLLAPGESIDAATLMTLSFTGSRAIIPDLLYVGLSILASRPKEGKSFLALELGACLSLGVSFLGHQPTQCEVLILALEDTLDRLQDRLRLLSYEANEKLHLSTTSMGLPSAIFKELDSQLASFPDIKVVVIDTLQKVRQCIGDMKYDTDYYDLGALKSYADSRAIAILLLHHTRKAEAESEFDRISGTSAITGASDTMMVLTRKGNEAILKARGREFEERELRLSFNEGNWSAISEEEVAARRESALPEPVKLTLDLMSASSEWSGTYKELREAIGCRSVTERALSQQLRDNMDVLSANGIELSWHRANRGTVVSLSRRAIQTAS